MNLFYVLSVLLLISPLILHEMGHWALLRKYNVPVTEFWVGLGPCLLKYRKLRIGMLPLGAAVVPAPDLYVKLTHERKMKVALAGPAFSLVSALVIYTWAYLSGPSPSMAGLVSIGHLNLFLAALNILPIPPLDGWNAWVHWRHSKNNPFAPSQLNIASRVGNGLIYGFGFMLLSFVLVGGPR